MSLHISNTSKGVFHPGNVYQLPQIPGNSGWDVKWNTIILARSTGKFPATNGKSEKVILFYRLGRSELKFVFHLTNRRQFSMVYTLIDHKMTSKNVQNSSGTTSRRRVVSLPSFGHFMASFYGL